MLPSCSSSPCWLSCTSCRSTVCSTSLTTRLDLHDSCSKRGIRVSSSAWQGQGVSSPSFGISYARKCRARCRRSSALAARRSGKRRTGAVSVGGVAALGVRGDRRTKRHNAGVRGGHMATECPCRNGTGNCQEGQQRVCICRCELLHEDLTAVRPSDGASWTSFEAALTCGSCGRKA